MARTPLLTALAAFLGTTARRGWRPQFARVESKANVADAVFRGDLSRAVEEGWTRLDDHADTITEILVGAAADAEYAAGQAVDDLYNAINCAGTEWGPRVPGGCTKCALPGASQFWGRDVGSRARSVSPHPTRRSAQVSALERLSLNAFLHAETRASRACTAAHAGSQLLPSHPPIWGELTSETSVQVDDDRPLGTRAGCTKCALPGASQFWGRDVGSRARSASPHPTRRSAQVSALERLSRHKQCSSCALTSSAQLETEPPVGPPLRRIAAVACTFQGSL